MARILFITRYYLPEKSAAAVCVSETAKRLVELGHQVTVLTTVPNYPTGIVPQEYRGRLLQEEVIDEVRVVRVWSVISPNKGFFRRILAQFSFGFLAPLLGGKAVGSPDIIIVESPPLFNVIAARILSQHKHVPFIFWVADLWPESAIQMGALRNRILIKLSEWLEWSSYQRACFVWAVTEGIRQNLIQRGLPPEHIFLLTNGVDTTRFRPLSRTEGRSVFGWDDRFSILYAGTHGLTHGLTTVLDAAELLQDHKEIHFILVGDGAEKSNLMEQTASRGLTNVSFHDPVSHERVPQLLAAADVCLAHTRKLQLFEGMLPMKMFEAMACERPILLALNGEARRIAVEEAGAALYVEPENALALAEAALYLCEHPDVTTRLGQRGREFAKERYDYDLLTLKLHIRLMSLLGKVESNEAPEVRLAVGAGVEENQT